MKRTKEFLQAHFLFWTIAIALASGCTGYWLHAHDSEGSRTWPAGSIPGVDYLTPPQSFSRVENTRNTLRALCVRERLEIQKTILLAEKRSAVRSRADESLESAIRECESAMHEFEGTDQEVYLAQDLLAALKRARRFDRWTEVYLKIVYQHPTHPVVGYLVRDAITVGRLGGYQDKVLAALKHLSAIPIEFENKNRIRAALNVTQSSFGFIRPLPMDSMNQ